MKKLLLIPLLMLVVGCAGLNRNTMNTEKLVGSTTIAAVHVFNEYYKNSTQEKQLQLEGTKLQVYSYSRNVAAALSLTESCRLQYVSSSNDTNKTALLLALEVLSAQSSNLVSTVKEITK